MHRTESARRFLGRRRLRPNLDRLEGRALLAVITPSSVPISPAAVEGASFTAVVAKFTDSDGNTDAGRYTAMIDWGDGHSSPGTVVPDSKAGFDVQGTHTYDEEGPFVVVATIGDPDGDSATVRTSNFVMDA